MALQVFENKTQVGDVRRKVKEMSVSGHVLASQPSKFSTMSVRPLQVISDYPGHFFIAVVGLLMLGPSGDESEVTRGEVLRLRPTFRDNGTTATLWCLGCHDDGRQKMNEALAIITSSSLSEKFGVSQKQDLELLSSISVCTFTVFLLSICPHIAMSKTFSKDAVAAHKKPDDLWIIVDDDVYDMTQFQTEHPVLQRVGGKDASKQFWKYHNESILKKYKAQLQVGSLDGKKQETAPPSPPPTPPPAEKRDTANLDKETVKPSAESGTVAPMPSKDAHEASESMDPYGALIPYADPSWYQSYHSPYFKLTHAALREEVRKWVEAEIEPNVSEWEEAKKVPDTIYKQMGERGYLAGLMGLHRFPEEYTKHRVRSVGPEQWDLFHELVVTDEISRAGSGGLVWNLIGGFGIGCPPLVKFGKKSVVDRILPDILNGDKRICLAITEPDAGSDVANLTCEAKLTEDGKHYIVNGEKKWITNGVWCDYFTTAVRTGGPGMSGVSALLIERSHGGVSTRKMDCQGVWASGTTYITFEDVKVPVENLIGKENQGFKVLMTNFNHERIGIIIQCIRFSRVCYEESVTYAHKRKTFGKRLIDHPVIRLKLAHMARQIEASYNWLENVIYQCQQMTETEAMLKLGGAIAGLKAQATTTFEFCAREASQIFGGLSYTRGGQGAKVERLYRDVRAYAIPGGSEEIMLDLSIRQALRVHKALGMKL
ncbi:MAG: hypothetical protein LQ341_005010 [Variospora aurantia]|nr:MAG: hypothetical protein LQ341_005010 [Variospora aurantia]